MPLKLKIESLEDVAEELRDAYIADGGAFVLDFKQISDHPGVAKVKKTADDVDKKRKSAEAELKKVTDKFGNVDLDAYAEAMKKIESLDDQKFIDAGEVDALVEKKAGTAIADIQAQLDAVNVKLDEAVQSVGKKDQELSDIKIYDAIKESAITKGIRKEALTDVSNRARGVWSLGEDGKPIAKDGEDVLRGGGGEHLTIDEWVDGLSTDSPYLFEPNSGGGAKGNENTNFSGAKVLSLEGAQNDLEKIASGEATISRP